MTGTVAAVLLILAGMAGMAGLAAGYFFFLFRRYRRRLCLATGRDQGYAIPTLRLADFDPRFRLGPYGPTLDAEVVFLGGADRVPYGTSDREAWILCVLARGAGMMFEFGTATGKTAYLMARNSPPEARVFTLTLPPDSPELYREEAGDRPAGREIALRESHFGEFLYSGTEAGTRITQLYGDSKGFDTSAFHGRFDLIFVDGAHAHSYVTNDSRKALRMVAPGGVVLWHDYRREAGIGQDVMKALDELARTCPLHRLEGTHLVAYRAPADRSPDEAPGPAGMAAS
jgi:predicted O-methyltransferase YrrM